ncbi:YpdA family putative bacillithiol disulfide reductase [Candidatus Sumerlaeota bacterium]|nr:YpdA family putative bacillithiol disulfide reductase [Candidatus Sumerlaeota bacterium]
MVKSLKTEIVIIGGGPAGLATANTLQAAGHAVMILEKGAIAEHVSRYPTYMNFFSTSDLLELGGFPLTIARDKPTRQEYLTYLRRFAHDKKLDIHTGHEVVSLEGERGKFILTGKDRWGEAFQVKCERAVLATGAFATPQMINIPGEELPKVSHYFKEVHPYYGYKVIVIGGKNSAVETALELWRAGVEVSICHRHATFNQVKYWLGPDIENRIKNAEIRVYRPARVIEIKPRSVILKREGRKAEEIENDFVLALTGYRPDPHLLGRFGIRVNPETGRPYHDRETLESERPGLYIVGVMLAGNVSSEIFIENSRTHGEQILAHLKNGASRKK